MSRSDRTDPRALRIWYSPCRVDDHDHDHDGPCDLPLTLDAHRAGGTRCTWQEGPQDPIACSCGCCRQWWWPSVNRRSRHQARRELGEVRRLVNAGHDVPEPAGLVPAR